MWYYNKETMNKLVYVLPICAGLMSTNALWLDQEKEPEIIGDIPQQCDLFEEVLLNTQKVDMIICDGDIDVTVKWFHKGEWEAGYNWSITRPLENREEYRLWIWNYYTRKHKSGTKTCFLKESSINGTQRKVSLICHNHTLPFSECSNYQNVISDIQVNGEYIGHFSFLRSICSKIEKVI